MAENTMAEGAHAAPPGPQEAMQQVNITETPGGQNRHGYPVGYVWGPACNYLSGPNHRPSNTYLTITFVAVNAYAVHVGIDIQMSRHDAQRLIDAAPNRRPLTAYLMADDGDGPNNRRLFPITNTWTRAVEGGLSAEFDEPCSAHDLDEDPGNSRDEVYALVDLKAPSFPQDRFVSGIIAETF